MMPPLTAALLQRIRALGEARAPAFGTRCGEVPVERYFDADQWQAEQDALFARLPLIVAHASEIGPGESMAHDASGRPLLLVRDGAGRLRCFLNVCRHRGMRLAGHSEARPCASLVCPYHGWTYRPDGSLRHRPHETAFDSAAAERALQALPCEERHGLVWVLPDARGRLDLGAWLGALDAELGWLELDTLVQLRKVECEVEANWKLVVDAFLEAYHVRVLHRETIYPFFADAMAASERIGPHTHSLVARRSALEPFGDPETPEQLRRLATPTQLLFPNTFTIFNPDWLSLVTITPLGPERLRWCHRMLVPRAKTTPDWMPHWDKTFGLIEGGVFQREDLHAAAEIQKGLRSGANRTLEFGRLEAGLGDFHDEVQRRIEAARARTI